MLTKFCLSNKLIAYVKAKGFLLLGLVVFSASLLMVVLSENTTLQAKVQPRKATPVSVSEAKLQAYRVPVSLVGVTQSRWQTKVTSLVEGTVVSLAQSLEPGTRLNKGQVLLSLSSEAYQAEVDAALSRLASAELELVKVSYEQQVAISLGAKLTTAFARFEPQVTLAKAEVNAAKSQLVYAQKRLADTQIRAPFDAIILQRVVTPGQRVSLNDELLTIAALDVLDVHASVSQSDWERLAPGLKVMREHKLKQGTLDDNKDNMAAQDTLAAYVETADGQRLGVSFSYLEPIRDPITRQYSLVMTLVGSYQDSGVLPEQQVKLVVHGKRVNSFMAPVSALTQDGEIWRIDNDNRIHLNKVNLLAQDSQQVWFQLAEDHVSSLGTDESLLLVRYPMSHLIDGQTVSVQNHNSQIGASK
jgi:RND family efflux transporter MFP subunit